MWLAFDGIVVEGLTSVSFRFAELVVPFDFGPRVLGWPRLDELESPRLGNPELCNRAVEAGVVMGGTSCSLIVDEVLG